MSLRFIFYIVLVFITTVYGLYSYKMLTKPYRLLVLLITCVFVSECSARWFALYHESSIPPYHILILVQMLLYPYIYLNVMPAGKWLKRCVMGFALMAVCFSIFNSLFLQTFFVFPSYSLFLLSLFTVFLAMLSFYFMLEQPVDKSPLKMSQFWFSFGNLFFYCITFFMFGFFTPFVKRSGSLPEWAFIFIFTANLGLYVCYFVALMLDKREGAHGN